tara:strand:- start:356 stop:538 length:183 start_codon:yes stop_codon:yes gene_type:complete
MNKVIIMLQLCLPNDGEMECIFSKHDVPDYQTCEKQIEQLEYEFSDLAQVFNVKCKEVEA